MSGDFSTQSGPAPPDDATYLAAADFPVGEDEIFRTFDQSEVDRAVYEAERVLEADVNAGETIETPTDLHSLAVAYWATHRLVGTAKHPSSTLRGELSSPDAAVEFAADLKDNYHSLVDVIEATDEDDVSEPGSRSHGSFVETVTPGSERD
jgi:hypothetical protein